MRDFVPFLSKPVTYGRKFFLFLFLFFKSDILKSNVALKRCKHATRRELFF